MAQYGIPVIQEWIESNTKDKIGMDEGFFDRVSLLILVF